MSKSRLFRSLFTVLILIFGCSEVFAASGGGFAFRAHAESMRRENIASDISGIPLTILVSTAESHQDFTSDSLSAQVFDFCPCEVILPPSSQVRFTGTCPSQSFHLTKYLRSVIEIQTVK
jgi:hypothetical protein